MFPCLVEWSPDWLHTSPSQPSTIQHYLSPTSPPKPPTQSNAIAYTRTRMHLHLSANVPAHAHARLHMHTRAHTYTHTHAPTYDDVFHPKGAKRNMLGPSGSRAHVVSVLINLRNSASDSFFLCVCGSDLLPYLHEPLLQDLRFGLQTLGESSLLRNNLLSKGSGVKGVPLLTLKGKIFAMEHCAH